MVPVGPVPQASAEGSIVLLAEATPAPRPAEEAAAVAPVAAAAAGQPHVASIASVLSPARLDYVLHAA